MLDTNYLDSLISLSTQHWALKNFTHNLLDLLILDICNFYNLSFVDHKHSLLLIGCLFDPFHGISGGGEVGFSGSPISGGAFRFNLLILNPISL